MDPATPGAERDQRQIEVGDYHLIFRRPGFRQDTTIGIEDHRVAGTHFVVITPHAVAEQNKQAIVMGTCR
ncbi:hypothetical protein D3C74_484900 [compost metagenome]